MVAQTAAPTAAADAGVPDVERPGRRGVGRARSAEPALASHAAQAAGGGSHPGCDARRLRTPGPHAGGAERAAPLDAVHDRPWTTGADRPARRQWAAEHLHQRPAELSDAAVPGVRRADSVLDHR